MSICMHLLLILITVGRATLLDKVKDNKFFEYFDISVLIVMFLAAAFVVLMPDAQVLAIITSFEPLQYELISYKSTTMIRFIKMIPLVAFNTIFAFRQKRDLVLLVLCVLMSVAESRLEYLSIFFLVLALQYNKHYSWRSFFVAIAMLFFLFIELQRYQISTNVFFLSNQVVELLLILFLLTCCQWAHGAVEKTLEVFSLILISTISINSNIIKTMLLAVLVICFLYLIAQQLSSKSHFKYKTYRQLALVLPLLHPDLIAFSFGVLLFSKPGDDAKSKTQLPDKFSPDEYLFLPLVILFTTYLLIFNTVGSATILALLFGLSAVIGLIKQVELLRKIINEKNLFNYIYINGISIIIFMYYYI